MKIFVLILLASLFLSFYPAQAQIAHEDPDRIPVREPYDVDLRLATSLEAMFGSLDSFASHLNASDFEASRNDIKLFSKYHSRFIEAYLKAGHSGSDMDAIAEKLASMPDDLWSTVNGSEIYGGELAQYLNYTAAGDMAGATGLAARMQVSYAGMSESMKRFGTNATSILQILDNSTIDTTRLENGIAGMNSYSAIAEEHTRASSGLLGDSRLSLYAGSREAVTGEPVSLTAVLALTGGASAGRLIRFYVNDNPAGSAVTDANGVCAMVYRVNDRSFARTMTMRAVFDPQGESLSMATSNTVEIERRPERAFLQVNAMPGVASCPDTINVYGTLTTLYGIPAEGQTVSVSMAGAPVANATTMADGSYSVTVPLRYDMPAGECLIQSTYDSPPDCALASALSSPCVMRILPVGSLIAFDQPPETLRGGEMTAFNGTLLSGDGRPVAGADVSVIAGDVPIGTVKTDDGGRFSLRAPIPYNITPGNHSVYASFSPAEGRALAGSQSVAFDTRFEPAVIQAIARGVPLIAFPGDDLNLTGVLMTGDSQPLDGRQITVHVAGAAEAMMTGPDGSYRLSRKVDGPGIYPLTVSISGEGLLPSADLGAGIMLVMPFDRMGTALAVIAVMLAAGMATARKIGRKSRKTVKQLPRPTVSLFVPKPEGANAVFDFGEELRKIDETISKSQDRREAVRSVYQATVRMLHDRYPRLPESITHRELCRLLSGREPALSAPIEAITTSYEGVVFGHHPPTDEDIYGSLYSLGELRKKLYGNGGSP